jgi:hypothetical protein
MAADWMVRLASGWWGEGGGTVELFLGLNKVNNFNSVSLISNHEEKKEVCSAERKHWGPIN